MSEPTKMHHTDTVELKFIGPATKADQAAKALKHLGFIDSRESVSWREAFPEYETDEFPGMILSGARLRAEFTQGRLSEMTGIPQSHISEMENGKRSIGKKHARLFAKALGCGYKIFL